MKTSNKLILSTVIVTVVSLVAYDFLLKAEYLSGNYKIPFKNYATLEWKDFDIVDVNASTVANIKFVQGPFSVRIDNDALDYVTVKQQANHLQIGVDFEGSGSKIIIQESNQFQDVNPDIRHNSKLQLENAILHNLKYKLADSAKLIVSGNAQDLLNNSNPHQK